MPRTKRSAARRVREEPASPYTARRLLLDTRTWLWWQTGDNRLGPLARRAIVEAADVRFSAASAWEVAIKVSSGKLKPPRGASIEKELEMDGFHQLPVLFGHAESVRALPAVRGDPFDRMLVAQAKSEGLTLVTAHRRLAAYGVPVLRATE